MMPSGEWLEWEELWQGDRTPPERLERLIARTRRARRGLWLLRQLSTVLAVASLAVVGAALRHAGNAFEIALGIVVGIGIGVVWAIDRVNQREASDRVEAPAKEYLAARRALCIRQDRFARLAWLVAALDLVFLIPWWIGGITVHGARLSGWQLLTTWGPLALIAGFVWWTAGLRRRSRAELAQLLAVPSEDVEPERRGL